MPNFICVTCGVQYAESEVPPAHCLICEDERQYVNYAGQQWTTLDNVRRAHHNVLNSIEPGLYSIRTEPRFGIGQTAHLVQTPHGNVLWDCISLIDKTTVEALQELGGVAAIAISHPHFYSCVVEWSAAFGHIPVYLHAADRQWMMRPDAVINFWEGETRTIFDGVTLIHCGGHFEGSSVLHWAAGAGGKGVILTGDTVDVVADQRYVTFMRSYPNMIPLNAATVRKIVAALDPFAFDRVYEAFGNVVTTDGKAAVQRSAQRYIAAISDH
jgi:glyoxylase-like metal-dependent hydrolase (beta-lactamase superfamily II)